MHVQIRWLIRRDMDEVLDIENRASKYPWDEERFLGVLRESNCIGMVAECNQKVLGFMVYELNKSLLKILNFAVHPKYHRNKIGRQMIQRLKDKLLQQRRRQLLVRVDETNIDAQYFFSAQDFKAVDVSEGDPDEDEFEEQYVFLYNHSESDPTLSAFHPANRIAAYYKT